MKPVVKQVLITAICLLFGRDSKAQCAAGFDQYIVQINPDFFPDEISWSVNDDGTLVASGGEVGDTVCIETGSCVVFTINDAAGDGIFAPGFYKVFKNGVEMATGAAFGTSATHAFGCSPGTYCGTPIPVDTGIVYTAPFADYWYSFTVPVTGMYEITTCLAANSCDTKIWVYDDCEGVFNETNAGTMYYDDDAGGCGTLAVVDAALMVGQTYIIRIGDDGTACSSLPIDWIIHFGGPVTGCTDPLACNYNPLATISDTCIYAPSILCPDAPDLIVDQGDFESTLYIGTQLSDACSVDERCLNGYGTRRIINFTTHIKNIGETDYYIGDPSSHPEQFSTDNCHGHIHYEGYAKYVLYDTDGYMVPIGFKSGFCVMDLECSGGGTAKFGCGNMGITAGCGDIYAAGLTCQWVDITDVPDGDYILAIQVNWDHSPDALGHFESDYFNNWGQVCISIYTDGSGQKNFIHHASCDPYVDCAGVTYGNAQLDCNGVCNGSAVMGDLDANGHVEIPDAQAYVSGIINETLMATNCNDLSDDGFLSVWDAGLAANCFIHGTPVNNECNFPNTIKNPTQNVEVGVLGINTVGQYVDIYIKNPDNKVVGYEIIINDIEIDSVANLINPSFYTIQPAYAENGNKVIGLSYVDSLIPKYVSNTPLCRVFYHSIGDSVCVSEVVHILNNNYEPVNTSLPLGCSAAVGSNELVDGIRSFTVYPNPAQNNITVMADVYAGETFQIVVRDLLGKVILQNTFSSQLRMHQLNLPALENGTYVVELKSSNASKAKLLVIEK